MGNYLCECIDTSNTSILHQQKLSLDLKDPPSFSLKTIVLSSPVSSDGDKRSTISTNDFEPTKLLDTGSLGNVIAVRNRNSSDQKLFAMKIIDKSKLNNRNTTNCSKLEKIIANKQSQFLVTISHIFQNPKKIFLTMEYIEPGDLFFYISKQTSFKQDIIKQVGAEVLQGLKVLSQEGIIHGNLKPENILVLQNGHIKLSGYWHSRFVKQNSLSQNFYQSLQYTSPETLKNQNNCARTDLWSFGILLYEMFHGNTPFKSGEQEQQIKNSILSGKYQFSDEISPELKDLITLLLSQNPNERPTMQVISNHKFFKQIQWSSLLQRKNPTPLKELIDKYNTRSHKAKFQKNKRLPFLTQSRTGNK